MLTAEQVIEALGLQPLAFEGGFYRETYRSSLTLPGSVLRAAHGGDKAAGTAIYFLLTPDSFSKMHRLPTDEVYHFYAGDPVELLMLDDGPGRVATLGVRLLEGELPQLVVPANVWQGSALRPGGAWALLGTTMAPGFDRRDFEAGDRAALQERYPEHRARIARLTA